jgi:predicted AAA+ superfamily ATPase
MAHYRPRYLEPWVRKMLGYSPIVGVFGHRQVGKTSLVERLSDAYHTFDDKFARIAAVENPTAFLKGIVDGHKTVIIDECQLVPELFPALKEFVRVHKRPGQFLLTGSVRFSSRKAIRESLTGRIVNITIPPLGSAEINQIARPEVIAKVMTGALKASANVLTDRTAGKPDIVGSVSRYASTGGLPGVCFIRDESVRASKFESQLETILERDLRLIYETTLPYVTLRQVLVELAANVGEPLNISNIQRKTRVAANTLKKLVSAFNAMFLIELIPATNSSGQPTVYFVDSGEARYLAGGRLSPGQILAQSIFSNISATCSSLWGSKVGPIRFSCYRTRGGANIPIVINSHAGSLGFLPWPMGMRFESVLAQTKSFMGVQGARGVIAIPEHDSDVKLHHEFLLEVPYANLLL